MNQIHFESQDGMLCGQHALNALLQGNYFSAVDLAEIAQNIDLKEAEFITGNSSNSATTERSHNFDDSGYFSIQVLSGALSNWNLDCVPYNHPSSDISLAARDEPTSQLAYLCNQSLHWFTIRKIGHQWFNLNSLLRGPELVSPTYLHLLLTQLQQEGYTIYVVAGALPHCDADDVLTTCPVDPAEALAAGSGARSAATASTPGDEELERVLLESKQSLEQDDVSLAATLAQSIQDQEDAEMARALALSMSNDESKSIHSPPVDRVPVVMVPSIIQARPLSATATPEDIRRNRSAFLDNLEKKGKNTSEA